MLDGHFRSAGLVPCDIPISMLSRSPSVYKGAPRASDRQGPQLLAKAVGAFRLRDWTQVDRNGLRNVGNMQAWMHWALALALAALVIVSELPPSSVKLTWTLKTLPTLVAWMA